MLESRIETIFLESDSKTWSSLFRNIYNFLFVENVALGIVSIIIVLALFVFLVKRVSSYKNIENRTSNYNNDEMDGVGSHTSLISNKSNKTNHIDTTKESNYCSDLELVAVITAAIMAHMGDDAPEDGLVIRSIRKVNRRNHVNNYSA